MIVDRLNERVPLPGGIDWRTIRTGITLAVLTAIFWWSWDRVKAVNALPEQVEQNTEAIQKIAPKLDKILVLMEQTAKRQMTVTGKVRVVENGHDTNGGCVWVNESSHANVYMGMDRVRVDNLDDPSRRASILQIRGTINAPGDVLAEICSTAATMLHAIDTDEIHVRIEPIKDQLVGNGP